MDKIPFSVYDFFGYLASGFVLLAGLAASFAGTDEWKGDPPTIIALLLIVVAYSAGHVVANVAGYVFEGRIVGDLLGTPTHNLFNQQVGLRVRLFPGYYHALPREQREACLAKARMSDPSQALFYRCFAAVKQHEPVMVRLNTFLNLYGFCRNMSMSLALVGAALAVGSLLGSAHTGDIVSPGWWAIGAVLGSVGLFYRYLKFFRHYSVEVFVSYAERSTPCR